MLNQKKGWGIMKVISDMSFGRLTTKWSWKNKRYGRIWKCTCECGGYCCVKEEALVMGIVKDCGGICHQKVVPSAIMESYAYAKGEMIVPEKVEKVFDIVNQCRIPSKE